MIVLAAFAAACTSAPTVTAEPVELHELLVRFEIIESADDMELFVRVDSSNISGTIAADELEQGTLNFIERNLGRECRWWQDVGLGTSVTLLNASRQIVGADKVPAVGTFAAPSADPGWLACVYEVEISEVAESDFYELEVSGESLATVARTQLEADGWTLAVELADS